jgi:hypothetical protein
MGVAARVVEAPSVIWDGVAVRLTVKVEEFAAKVTETPTGRP